MDFHSPHTIEAQRLAPLVSAPPGRPKRPPQGRHFDVSSVVGTPERGPYRSPYPSFPPACEGVPVFIVKFKDRRGRDARTARRFHVTDADLARARVWAGLRLGWTIRLQLPDGRVFGN